jgi:hypothetical protein
VSDIEGIIVVSVWGLPGFRPFVCLAVPRRTRGCLSVMMDATTLWTTACSAWKGSHIPKNQLDNVIFLVVFWDLELSCYMAIRPPVGSNLAMLWGSVAEGWK